MAPRRRSHHPLGVASVRTWLPLALVLAAVVVLITGPRGLAPGLLVTAMFVIVADWIIRIAISSQTDRDREASARTRFARSGHWPEDEDEEAEEAAEAPDRDDRAEPAPHDAPHRTSQHRGAPSGSAGARPRRDRRPPRRR